MKLMAGSIQRKYCMINLKQRSKGIYLVLKDFTLRSYIDSNPYATRDVGVTGGNVLSFLTKFLLQFVESAINLVVEMFNLLVTVLAQPVVL